MSRRQQHGLALGVAVAALTLMTWGMSRPALWLDEAASVVATQRTWSDLWVLLGGPEAPLVPYYVLLKVTSFAVTAVSPAWAASSPEALARWSSVAVTVLAMWALTLWLARRSSPALAVSTATLLLATASFSRYGQEARPYAFVVAAAVVATILWTRLLRDRRRRWILLYALAVAAVAAAHLLAASLVLAHLAAAVVMPDRRLRRSAVLRTSGAAALGVLLVSPIVVMAALHGHGPPGPGSLPAFVPSALVATLTVGGVLALGLGVAAALAAWVVGAAPPRYRSIAWLAAAWAVVPLMALLPVLLLRPNLLMSRYAMFVLPGWAILGGLAIVRLADVLGRGMAHLVGRTGPDGAPWRRRLAAASSVGVGVLAVAMVVASQIGPTLAIRTPGGHGEDIRPALAAADRTEYAQLPIIVSPPKDALQLAAYARADEDRLVGLHIQRDGPSIWPALHPQSVRKRELRQHDRVVLLLKAGRSGDCRWTSQDPPVASVSQCLPSWLQGGAYEVELAEADGYRWIFAVLHRNQQSCASVPCDP